MKISYINRDFQYSQHSKGCQLVAAADIAVIAALEAKRIARACAKQISDDLHQPYRSATGAARNFGDVQPYPDAAVDNQKSDLNFEEEFYQEDNPDDTNEPESLNSENQSLFILNEAKALTQPEPRASSKKTKVKKEKIGLAHDIVFEIHKD